MGIGMTLGMGWGSIALGGGIPAAETAFVFTVQTDNVGTSATNQFTIPITSATPYNIKTSDGQSITGATGATTLTFPSAGEYEIKISESCSGWRFANGGDRRKLLDISNWGVYKNTVSEAFRGATNMTCSAIDAPINQHTELWRTFYDCTNFNGAIGNWDVSQVVRFSQCFYNASSFNQPIDSWDVSGSTGFAYMFSGATSFNQPLNSWNVSGAADFSIMFSGATSFNQPLDNWDTSSATNMASMFAVTPFNQDISGWDVSNVTNFGGMFDRNLVFNQPIGIWNVSSATAMNRMFHSEYVGRNAFNQPINSWDVSNVTSMEGMFNSSSFDQDISSWNVGSVTDMLNMFRQSLFNQPLNSWDVSNVTRMEGMFYSDNAFNQPLNNWNTSSVTNMREMLMAARGFDQDISTWDINQVTNFINFGGYAGFSMTLSTANYDALLAAWEAQVPQNNISITFGASKYSLGSAAETARTSLINTYGWTITDGGGVAAPLILRVDTSLGNGLPNMSLPMVSGFYDVDWGDGNLATGQAGSQTHAYATGGVYDIRVTGGTHLQYNFGADILKVTNLLQWGSSAWLGAYGMFGGCENMVITATDIPDFSTTTNFQRMFRRTTFTNVPNIDQWNVSNATILSEMFQETACDPDVSSWQITQVTNFSNFAIAPSAFTTVNYDNILVSWEAQLQAAFPGGVGYTPTISINFAGTQYTLGSAAETARTSLINTYGWTITDGGGIVGPSYVYSVYDITGNATNSIMISNNSLSEIDIPFNAGFIDTSLITSHSSGNYSTVTTFYDQVGGSDLTESTKIYQPRITDASGTSLTYLDDYGERVGLNNLTNYESYDLTGDFIFQYVMNDETQGNNQRQNFSHVKTGNNISVGFRGSGSNYIIGIRVDGVNLANRWIVTKPSQFSLYTFTGIGGVYNLYINNVLQTSDGGVEDVSGAGPGITLGYRGGQTSGKINDVQTFSALYNNDLSAFNVSAYNTTYMNIHGL